MNQVNFRRKCLNSLNVSCTYQIQTHVEDLQGQQHCQYYVLKVSNKVYINVSYNRHADASSGSACRKRTSDIFCTQTASHSDAGCSRDQGKQSCSKTFSRSICKRTFSLNLSLQDQGSQVLMAPPLGPLADPLNNTLHMRMAYMNTILIYLHTDTALHRTTFSINNIIPP